MPYIRPAAPAVIRKKPIMMAYRAEAGYTKPRRSYLKRTVFLVLAILFLAGFWHIDKSHKAAARELQAAQIAKTDQLKQTSFKQAVNSILAANSGITFSVATINLSSGASQQFGSSDAMDAASVGKLLTAALYLHSLETGTASLNNSVNGYSAKYELQQMINQSDDDAWAAFNEQLGHANLNNYATSIGIKSYDADTNTISASDVALLLQKLYKGQLLNKSNTQLLLGYMQNTNLEEYIPPALSAGQTIYHKVGENNDDVNDAAIITSGNKSFALVIFTNGNGIYDWNSRASLMQQITKASLDYYF